MTNYSFLANKCLHVLLSVLFYAASILWCCGIIFIVAIELPSHTTFYSVHRICTQT